MTLAEIREVRDIGQDLEFAYASEDDDRIERLEARLDEIRQYKSDVGVDFMLRAGRGTIPGEFLDSGVVPWQPIASW